MGLLRVTQNKRSKDKEDKFCFNTGNIIVGFQKPDLIDPGEHALPSAMFTSTAQTWTH